jgi:hypothetical protein
MNRISLVVEAHCRAGAETHAALHWCAPKLWAVGPVERIIAQPGETAVELDGTQTVLMLTALSHEVNAWAIGRTVEVYLRTVDTLDEANTYQPGNLAQQAETDPTITTAIIAEGLDTHTGRTALHVAIWQLDDNGNPEYHHNAGQHLDERFLNLMRAAHAYDHYATHPAASLRSIEANTGWLTYRI